MHTNHTSMPMSTPEHPPIPLIHGMGSLYTMNDVYIFGDSGHHRANVHI